VKSGQIAHQPEQTVTRLPAGTLKRVKAALRPGESQMQFLARAIIKEIERSERAAARRTKLKP
jgi:hypothetical protein